MSKLRQLCAKGIGSQSETFFIYGMKKWMEQLQKCEAVNGDYVDE
jgi:hypothetical protein